MTRDDPLQLGEYAMSKKALVVGIDDYPNGNELRGCVNDARAVGELLEKNEDGSPDFDVKFQLDKATKGGLRGAISDLFSGNADAALFYFSGHGSEDGYIVTPDFQEHDVGVSMSEILAYANSSKCRNRIIILDSCYSGKMGEGMPNDSKDSLLAEGVTIMAACSREETSVETKGHGLFTNLFTQALTGRAADVMGRITPASIYAFVDQSLGAWQQRPLFKTNTSSFISIRNTNPRVSKESLRNLSRYFKNEDDEFKLDPSFEYTNDLTVEHKVCKPYANEENVKRFKELQKYQSIGLVEPVDEDYMYFAAMNSKSCRLTRLGKHYWQLSRDKRF